MEKERIVRKGHFRDVANTEEFQRLFLREKDKQASEEPKEEKKEKRKEKDAEAELKEPEGEGHGVADKLVRKLMLPEDQQKGEVEWKIFKEYIRLNGGYCKFGFFILLAMLIWISFTIAAAIIIQLWCEDPAGNSHYLYLYIGFSLASTVFIFFRVYNLFIASARQGEIVHKNMVRSLLYASLGDFFNRVPVGRIINRLTKDLRELD
jgi:hypothetical protein